MLEQQTKLVAETQITQQKEAQSLRKARERESEMIKQEQVTLLNKKLKARLRT